MRKTLASFLTIAAAVSAVGLTSAAPNDQGNNSEGA